MSNQNNNLTITEPHFENNQRNALDKSRAGVKGLVDTGISEIPEIFIRPTEEISRDFKTLHNENKVTEIPVIDFANLKSKNGRENIIKEIMNASEKWGVFHIINHGIKQENISKVIKEVKKFHEQNIEVKGIYYNREITAPVSYFTNNHLQYKTKSAAWRDTLFVKNLNPAGIHPQQLPSICGDAIMEHTSNMKKVGELVLELISVGHGLDADFLREIGCSEGWAFMGHYYPSCPQPELTLGMNKHTDPSFVTLLVQDQIGGLQVLHNDFWVNVEPYSGALTLIIGGVLQIITNDKLKGVWHRAIANGIGPRISVNMFLTGLMSSTRKYGPIKELISEENLPLYRQFTMAEMFKLANTRTPDTPVYGHFKLQDRSSVENGDTVTE